MDQLIPFLTPNKCLGLELKSDSQFIISSFEPNTSLIVNRHTYIYIAGAAAKVPRLRLSLERTNLTGIGIMKKKIGRSNHGLKMMDMHGVIFFSSVVHPKRNC